MKQVTKQTYKIFWQHLREYKGRVATLLITSAGASILSIVVPLYYKRFFDVLSSEVPGLASSNTLIFIIAIILLLNAIYWLFARIGEYTLNTTEARVIEDINNSSFQYLQQHSYRFFINRFAGALVRKLNRLVDAFEEITDRVYWNLYPLAIRILLMLAVLFVYNALIGWVVLIWIVLYVIINYAFTVYKLKYDTAVADMDTTITANLADTITNNTNIKLFTSLPAEQKRHWDLAERRYSLHRFTWNLGSHMNAFQSTLMFLLEFAVFYVAIRYWRLGQVTVGDFVLFQTYLVQIFTKLWDFGKIFRDIYKHLANAQEMTEIMNTPHEVQDKPRAKQLVVTKGEVKFDHVQFSYHMTRSIITDLSLHIAPGEKIGIVGPSGSGKTTLVGLICRLFNLSSGSISIDGQNIADVTQDSLRSHIGLVPQDPILFHRTLAENIRYGKPDATEQEVTEASKLAHCHEFISQLPEGYNTFVGERGIKLSGGERQRVAIARAILKNAPILVLDEATSSLDSRSEFLIQDALAKLMQGKTSIVIAHRLSTIMRMDRIVVLENGKVRETGTHQELIADPDSLYKKLWDLQVGGFIE